MNKTNFAKGVERLIDPISVGTLHFMQSFNQLLPKSIQKQFVKSSSKKHHIWVLSSNLIVCFYVMKLKI
jgi:hypothetical protein